MSAAGGDEGLFVLEVLVEEVRVAAPGPALRPVVALRLLGFPALLLRPAAAASPLRPGRAFPFGRGKRCLFRWRRGSLCAALRRQPVRALLLALPVGHPLEPPRLLGSCSISLAPASVEVLQRPGEAVRWGRRGCFPLRDAAGRTVGELVLGFRLSSLEAEEGSGPAMPPHPSPAPEEEGEEEEEAVDEEEEQGEEDGNIICPPVLYYSREPAEPRLPSAAAMGHWERVVVRSPQEQREVQSPPRPSAGPSLLHPSSPQQLHSTLTQLPLLSALLAELSVLTHSATPAVVHPHLAWLYQAPGDCGMGPRPSSHSPPLKTAEVPVRPSGNRARAASPQIKQGQQQTTLPGSSQAGKRSKKAAPHGQTGSERNRITKENTPPRRKLLYGLTNTLRLRLQQTNPDKLILLERREQYRKKQAEMVKVRSPLSKRKPHKNAGEQRVVSHRQCSKGDRSKQNGQVDETVETSSQNSALKEYFSSTDVCPDLQKQAAESLWRNSETASKEHPCKAMAASLLEKTILKSAHEEKDLEVQLLAAFTSDANVKGSNDNEIIHETMEHDYTSVASDQKRSPSMTVEKSSEFIYSDDFVASPDNTVYSEDFTSAECTGRDLEALDSSPEALWLESPNRPRPDTELESSMSRVSKASERAESMSDLLPVHSSSSPVSSLKRNHGFKNSKGTSGESFDLLNDTSIWAGLLDEEQETHQVDKEENRVDQHIKQASVLRSEQVSSATDLNIGKGQTSAEKNQSVTQVCSYLPCNLSDLELSDVENSRSGKDDDFLGDLHAPNQYKDISELVINSLPGYTV
ncbi:microtubule-associated protein 10 [Numida meleagris]|uniref:microtubule-associated protein 10 n=1 Tax=Numida meleagris TaxID=8996 RepID=UPI000B3DFCDD|nr:microtubule-associated protein 10 [Numida meleagris]